MNLIPGYFYSMHIFLAASFWQNLEQWDRWLFTKINHDGANSFFDSVMPFLRNSPVWIPLYLFVGLFALFNFKGKGIWWCVFFIATAAMTDMVGNYVFKHNFQRLRPCGDPAFMTQVRLLVDRCVGYSFVSNHAINHFGLAAFFYITMKPVLRKWAAIAFVWSALIIYAQVYVGLHYPLDVLAGSLLGIGFGTLTGRLFNKRFGFVIFDNQPTLSS